MTKAKEIQQAVINSAEHAPKMHLQVLYVGIEDFENMTEGIVNDLGDSEGMETYLSAYETRVRAVLGMS